MKAGDKIVAINSVRVLNDDDDYIASLFRNSRTSVVIKLTRAGITLFSILTSMFSTLYSYLCVHLFMINSIFITGKNQPTATEVIAQSIPMPQGKAKGLDVKHQQWQADIVAKHEGSSIDPYDPDL